MIYNDYSNQTSEPSNGTISICFSTSGNYVDYIKKDLSLIYVCAANTILGKHKHSFRLAVKDSMRNTI